MLAALLQIGGLCVVAVALGLIYLPAGLLFAGAAAVTIGLAIERRDVG